MDKVFLDTNIILDYLVPRPLFLADAEPFFKQAELGKLELYVSTLSFW
jgi:predicted nucleic acid-binding protein